MVQAIGGPGAINQVGGLALVIAHAETADDDNIRAAVELVRNSHAECLNLRVSKRLAERSVAIEKVDTLIRGNDDGLEMPIVMRMMTKPTPTRRGEFVVRVDIMRWLV